jgi:hypothetical protein
LCFLVAEKIKLKVLACSFEITYQLRKMLPVTRFKYSKAAIFTLKMLTGSSL